MQIDVAINSFQKEKIASSLLHKNFLSRQLYLLVSWRMNQFFHFEKTNPD